MKQNNKKWYLIVLLLLTVTAGLFFMLRNTQDNAQETLRAASDSKTRYQILVDIQDNILYLLDGKKLVKQYSIASGKPSTPSPVGYFKITGKANWGEGFGGYWMGFNVPWGKYMECFDTAV